MNIQNLVSKIKSIEPKTLVKTGAIVLGTVTGLVLGAVLIKKASEETGNEMAETEMSEQQFIDA